MSGKPIDEATRAQIIELRLQRVPHKRVAETVKVTVQTVHTIFHQYLDETAKDRAGRIEGIRQEQVARLEDIGTNARAHYLQAVRDKDWNACARFMRVEIQTIMSQARLEGTEAPQNVIVTPDPDTPLVVQVTIEPLTEAQRRDLAAATLKDLADAGFVDAGIMGALVQSSN